MGDPYEEMMKEIEDKVDAEFEAWARKSFGVDDDDDLMETLGMQSIDEADLADAFKDAARLLHSEIIKLNAIAEVREVTMSEQVKEKDSRGEYIVNQSKLIKELLEELKFWRFTSEGATEQEDYDRCDNLISKIEAR